MRWYRHGLINSWTEYYMKDSLTILLGTLAAYSQQSLESESSSCYLISLAHHNLDSIRTGLRLRCIGCRQIISLRWSWSQGGKKTRWWVWPHITLIPSSTAPSPHNWIRLWSAVHAPLTLLTHSLSSLCNSHHLGTLILLSFHCSRIPFWCWESPPQPQSVCWWQQQAGSRKFARYWHNCLKLGILLHFWSTPHPLNTPPWTSLSYSRTTSWCQQHKGFTLAWVLLLHIILSYGRCLLANQSLSALHWDHPQRK